MLFMKLVFCNNSLSGLYTFRRDVYLHFIKQGHEVIVIYPKSIDELFYQNIVEKQCRCIPVDMFPNSQNILLDFKLYKQLKAIYKKERPDMVFNYTIKPNIYSAFAARSLGIRTIDMMAGLGYVFNGLSINKILARALYRFGLNCADKVIVLNQDNYNTIVNKYVHSDKLILFEGGEGVNMKEYPYKDNHFENIRFLMVARLLYDKGFQQFVDAAEIVKKKFPQVKFELLGGFSEDSPTGVKRSVLQEYVDKGIIDYLGVTNDVPSYVLRDGIVVVVASYYMEGMNRALMEACSMGRPIITTNLPGRKEMVDDGITGYCIEPKNAQALADACMKFIELSEIDKVKMAKASYEKCKKQFDVVHVLEKYDDIVNELV